MSTTEQSFMLIAVRAGSLIVAAAVVWPLHAAAADPAPSTPGLGAGATPAAAADGADPAEDERFSRELEHAPPPPSNVVYFQYGVAFTANQVLSPGAICDDLTKPCILGSGGGVIIRGGWRSSGPLYLGGAYELTKQDPNKLYRIALLQQARFEARYYVPTHRIVEPYGVASVGVIGYGNEWKVDTWGGTGSIGGGLEYQITQTTVVGVGLTYRLAYMRAFFDSAGTNRAAGVAQMLALDIVLEQRAAIFSRSDDK